MKNATMLFKHPGPHKADDGTYEYIVVDADQTGALDAAVEEGWSLTVREAVVKATPAQPEPAPDPAAAQAEALADQEAQPEPAPRTRKAKE